jgi:hypothetical protein
MNDYSAFSTTLFARGWRLREGEVLKKKLGKKLLFGGEEGERDDANAIERALLSADFLEDEDEDDDEEEEPLFLPSIPNRRAALSALRDALKGPLVWQVVDAKDVSRAKKSEKANELSMEDYADDEDEDANWEERAEKMLTTNNKRMLKVRMTDGYSEIDVLERVRWSKVDRAPSRWERQLMPGTKVLVRDLKVAFGPRGDGGSGSSVVGTNEHYVAFADTDANFQVLGGQVERLKEKFEKKMRMKAASRFADDGFSLGDVGKAPKFQPFDAKTWKEFERERKAREEEERKEKEEQERKEKMERMRREKEARKELRRDRMRAEEREEDDEDDCEEEEEEEEEEMQPARAKPKLPPKRGVAALSQPPPAASSNQQQQQQQQQQKKQQRAKPSLPDGNKRGSNNKEENANALSEEKRKRQHEIQAKKERSKILEKLSRPPPQNDDVRSQSGQRGGGSGGRGGRGGRGQRGGSKSDPPTKRDEKIDDDDAPTLTMDQLRAKKLAEKLQRESFTAPLGRHFERKRDDESTSRRGVPGNSRTAPSSSSSSSSRALAAQLFTFKARTEDAEEE